MKSQFDTNLWDANMKHEIEGRNFLGTCLTTLLGKGGSFHTCFSIPFRDGICWTDFHFIKFSPFEKGTAAAKGSRGRYHPRNKAWNASFHAQDPRQSCHLRCSHPIQQSDQGIILPATRCCRCLQHKLVSNISSICLTIAWMVKKCWVIDYLPPTTSQNRPPPWFELCHPQP